MCTIAVFSIVLLGLLGFCLACPRHCRCDIDLGEVRCQLSGAAIPDFSELRVISERYSRLVLRNSSLTQANLQRSLTQLSHVTDVDLSWNRLASLTAVQLPGRSRVKVLDLSHNRITRLDICRDAQGVVAAGVARLSLRGNALNNLTVQARFCDAKKAPRSSKLTWRHLDLSSNRLQQVDLPALLDNVPFLSDLNLSSNILTKLTANGGRSVRADQTRHLTALDASHNAFTSFNLPVPIPSLLSVNLSGNGQLRRVDYTSLHSISSLDLSDCRRLAEFDSAAAMYSLRQLDLSRCAALHRLDLSMFPKLSKVNLSRSNVTTLLPPISWLTGNPGVLNISFTQNWNCSCDVLWVSAVRFTGPALCAMPLTSRGKPVPKVLPDCETPFIRNFTKQSVYGLGEKAKLECRVGGSPHPMVLWKTPSQKVFVYRQPTTFKFHTPEETQGSLFHRSHPWHGSHLYRYQLSDSGRLFYILTDGSLYIDYVTRLDAGAYSCTVLGPNGNASLTMQLSLNYDILRAVRWHSQIVGMVCAGCMLGIGFTVGVIKMVARRCRSLEREKHHRTLKVLVENLESYRANKVDKFRAYRSNKMDQLRDNYSGQMTRIKESCLTHMVNMQEHYNRRIAKIRENYVIRIEGLRESYASQMLRIKDYRSHQVERLRENYNQQILRIREYASAQLVRIREQYRLQQQLFIKLLEALSLENCMAVDVDELDDAINRGAQASLESDDDSDDMILNEHLPTARVLVGRDDVEMGVIDSLASLPTLDLDFFVPVEAEVLPAGDSPVRSGSPVSDDYQTADSDYEVSMNQVVVCLNARPGESDDSRSVRSAEMAMA